MTEPTEVETPGLLADPAQTTELEELRARPLPAEREEQRARLDETQQKLAEADRRYDDLLAQREQWWESVAKQRGEGEAQRDALSLLLRGMARKLVAARAELEEWRAELEEWRAAGADGGPEWPLARVRDALGTPRGRAVSVHAAEVIAERDQAVDAVAHAVRLLREAGVNRGNGLPARVSTLIGERDALEEILSKERRRVDAALAIRDQPNNVAPRHDFSAGWKHAIDAVRAALVGDQPGEAATPSELPSAPSLGVRPRFQGCCIGPFDDGRHALNCVQRCQDCKGDPNGPYACRCRDAGPNEDQEKRAAADWPAESVDAPAPGDHS